MPILGIGHHQSAWAGGFALAIIMLPLVSRTTMEVLALVPNHLREASYALGVSKWRTVLSVVVPSALGGIVTGTTLAVARAAGETAPLLFTCSIFGQIVSWDPSNSVASIPVIIFEYSESPDQHLNAAGVGGGVRADRGRARHEPARAHLARPPAPQARPDQLSAAFTTPSPVVTHLAPTPAPCGGTLAAHRPVGTPAQGEIT